MQVYNPLLPLKLDSIGPTLVAGTNISLVTANNTITISSTGGSSVVGANPTASVGLTAVNGVATTFLRSDGAPALDQSIAPTWTALHTFSGVGKRIYAIGINNTSSVFGEFSTSDNSTAGCFVGIESSAGGSILTNGTASFAVVGSYKGLQFGTGASSTVRQTIDSNGSTTFTQGVIASAAPASALTVTTAAHTALTASTEGIGINFNTSATKQWATGALTTQREVVIQAPTYAFVGASTITNATVVNISGLPVAGTNATITNKYYLTMGNTASPDFWFGSGAYLSGQVAIGTTSVFQSGCQLTITPSTSIGIRVNISGVGMQVVGINDTAEVYNFFGTSGNSGKFYYGLEGSSAGALFTGTTAYACVLGTDKATSMQFATNNAVRFTIDSNGNNTFTQAVQTTGSPTALTLTGAAHTTLTASAESIGVNLNFSATKQFATGAITTQREILIQAPTYGFVGASTLTTAVTLEITGAPIQGTNATLTNAYALRVNAGTATGIAGVFKGAASRTAPILQLQNSAAASMGNVGGTIFNDFTDTTTTHTDGTEDDLYSYTTVANTFAINGDSIEMKEHVQFVSSATAARRLKKYFAGTLVFDSGSLTLTLGGDFMIETTVIRESSTVVRVSVSVVTTSASSVPYATYTRITGLTLTNTNIIKTTGIASGTGAASGDIVDKWAKVLALPAA